MIIYMSNLHFLFAPLALRFLRISDIEHYSGFTPFSASTALYSESSENSCNANINARVRYRARARNGRNIQESISSPHA